MNMKAAQSEPASPSMPSIMLIALIRPTVAITVIGTDRMPSPVSREAQHRPDLLHLHAADMDHQQRRDHLRTDAVVPAQVMDVVQQADHAAAASAPDSRPASAGVGVFSAAMSAQQHGDEDRRSAGHRRGLAVGLARLGRSVEPAVPVRNRLQ
ncbi:hypothetical protein MASR1M8_12630 [Thermomonas brevis]